jgi:putative peptidoglycan lipid II flippase
VSALLGIAAAPVLIYVTAPGFAADADKFELTVELTRITFPYILFMSLVALAAGVLNTWSRFALPAFTPVLLNLSFIGMALFAAPWFDPPVLAWPGRSSSAACCNWRSSCPPWRRSACCRASTRLARRGRAAHPQADGARRAGRFGVADQPADQYHLRLLPRKRQRLLALLRRPADGISRRPARRALGTILLPSLAKTHADGNSADFSALLDWGLRLTLMLTLPASLALALLAVPLLSTLFQYGAFAADDVLRTREALVAYSIGLTGLILVKVLAPGFYARQDIRTPVKIALVTLAADTG